MMDKQRWTWFLGVVTVLAGISAMGAGFQLYTEGSAESLGQGGAISARRDMVSNAWYNPASTTDFSRPQFMIGDTTVRLKINYDDNTNGSWNLERHWRQIPHLYYVQPFNERITGTLSLNLPYGLATDWEDGWPGSATVIDTRIQALYLTPAIAWKASDKLSLALGVNLVRGDAYMRRFFPAMGPLPATTMELSGSDYAYGYLAAVNYRVNEAWNVGLKFQSKVDLTLHGDIMYSSQFPGVYENGNAKADVRLPASVTFGVTNHSLDRWTFGMDIVWTKWNGYDNLPIWLQHAPGTGTAGVPGSTQPAWTNTKKDWNNVFSLRLGAEYQLDEHWRLRGGYVFDQSPVSGDTRAPEMPGSDRHMFMLGFGYDTQSWGLDFAYSYLIARDVDGGNGVPIGGVYHGNYKTRAHLLSLSYRYKF